jgi:predicted PurR-regulated permease PerM
VSKKQLPERNETRRVVIDESSPHWRSIVRIVIIVLAILYAIDLFKYLFYGLRELLLLVILAIFFAYLIAPLTELIRQPFVERGAERLMPRWAAIALAYLGVFAFLFISISYLSPRVSEQIRQFAAQTPNYAETIRTRTREIEERYKDYPIPPKIREEIESKATTFLGELGNYGLNFIGFLVIEFTIYLPWLVLIPVLGFFFLKDAWLFREAAVQFFPPGTWRGRAEVFFHDLNVALAAYIRAQLISCLLIGFICTLGFYFLDLRYTLLLGILAGIFEFIPLAGPLVIGILATLIASFYSGSQALAVAIFLLVLRMIHDYITYPRIVRESVHLHPLAVILAILAGAELAGITGIFLAIPVVAICTVIYKHVVAHSLSHPSEETKVEEPPADAETA